MRSPVIASALVFLMAGPARSQIVQCERFDRSHTDAPQFVRDWLDGDSERLYVSVCGNYQFYFGASNLVREGNVCRHVGYELNLSTASPSRLERTTWPPSTYVLVSQLETCPSPLAIHYAGTDVPPSVFERLVHIWHGAIASPASFDRAVSWAFVADDWRRRSRSRLRDVILQGRSDRLTVLGVYMRRDLRLWRSYDLHIKDPDHSDRDYAVTVSSFGWAYAITDVQTGMY